MRWSPYNDPMLIVRLGFSSEDKVPLSLRGINAQETIGAVKLEFHRENRTHRAASDASDFPGGILALSLVWTSQSEPVHEVLKQIVNSCYYLHSVRTPFEPVLATFSRT